MAPAPLAGQVRCSESSDDQAYEKSRRPYVRRRVRVTTTGRPAKAVMTVWTRGRRGVHQRRRAVAQQHRNGRLAKGLASAWASEGHLFVMGRAPRCRLLWAGASLQSDHPKRGEGWWIMDCSRCWGLPAMLWKGGRPPPPPSRAPSLCPATVPLTPSAGFNGICNRR